MKKRLFTFILLTMCACVLVAQEKYSHVQDEASPNKKMEWWHDAKYGMFIHWGLYSETAGDWRGKPTKGGEHFMLYERIPVKEYAKIGDRFNPLKFDAKEWVQLVKAAGMKYLVITAKHHDGFAMYDSPSSDYNIVKGSVYGKDPMKPLFEEARRQGLKVGFYYSLGRDWEDPDVPTNWPEKAGRSNTWDYPDEDAKDLNKYIERKVKPQIKELLTQYGPVDILWFDTPELVTKKQSKEIKQLALSIQPKIIINNRIGNGMGDYQVVEQSLVTDLKTNWEACMTMGKNWGYNKYDTIVKSPEKLVRNLVETVSKGGNFLLNVGPKGDGSISERFKVELKTIGKWLEINGESIYDTKPWKVYGEGNLTGENNQSGEKGMEDAVFDGTPKNIVPDIRFTAKDNVVYVFLRSPDKRQMKISTMAGEEIKSVSLLGYSKDIYWKSDSSGLLLDIPSDFNTNGIPVYVYKVELE